MMDIFVQREAGDRYVILYDRRPDGTCSVLPWRTARRVLTPDEFYTLARATFADWTARHGIQCDR